VVVVYGRGRSPRLRDILPRPQQTSAEEGTDGDYSSEPLRAAMVTTPSPRPNFDRSQQSLPLLEATLVQDVPEEPVYNATLVQRISKFRAVVLGSVLVAMAAVVAVVVIVFGSLKEPPTPPITTSTSSTSAPGTETNTVSE
jgi:hypothetical protein